MDRRRKADACTQAENVRARIRCNGESYIDALWLWGVNGMAGKESSVYAVVLRHLHLNIAAPATSLQQKHPERRKRNATNRRAVRGLLES